MANSLSDCELQEIYQFALDLGKRAGKILEDEVDTRCGAASERNHEKAIEKTNAVDIVTQTDLDIEAFIHGEVERKYPSHKFIGEETYSAGQSKNYLITDEPTWVVDPLDGTVNYTHLFPMFCVSIALCIKGQPVIGIIFQPMLDVTYSACRGHGAWMDDGRRRRQLPFVRAPGVPLNADAPKGCVFSCEWGKDRRAFPDGNLARKVESFVTMASELSAYDGRGGMVHGVRSLGSATLDLAYVATGAFDIWWEGGCWEWDVAAGIAILVEAGGLVTTANPPADIDGAVITDVNLGSRLYLAVRPAADTDDETAREAQERVVRAVWRRVRALSYVRPGS